MEDPILSFNPDLRNWFVCGTDNEKEQMLFIWCCNMKRSTLKDVIKLHDKFVYGIEVNSDLITVVSRVWVL